MWVGWWGVYFGAMQSSFTFSEIYLFKETFLRRKGFAAQCKYDVIRRQILEPLR